MISLDLQEDADRLVETAVEAMRDGGVVLLPTDTVYGLACDPRRIDGVDAIYRLKQRPPDRRLPVIVTDAAQARELGVDWTDAAARLAAAWWPGALTIAVGVGVPAVDWLPDRDEIALRAPASDLALGIARELGPFLMTSANLHGQGTPPSARDALASLYGEPDVAIDGGPLSIVASTLVNVNLPEPRIEREGAVPAAEVERVLSDVHL